MEYAYTALILTESGEELNEDNITGVLEAAGVDVEESRVKALVAALEDVAVDDVIPETDVLSPDTGGNPAGADSDTHGSSPDGEEDARDTVAAEQEAEPVQGGGEPTERDADVSQPDTAGGG